MGLNKPNDELMKDIKLFLDKKNNPDKHYPMKAIDIAKKYGVSPQDINYHIKKFKLLMKKDGAKT